jgi:hypothetical protein
LFATKLAKWQVDAIFQPNATPIHLIGYYMALSERTSAQSHFDVWFVLLLFRNNQNIFKKLA